MKTSATRFSDRVDDYIKYRPGYPREVINILVDKLGLDVTKIIADIGAGTGISTQLFLNNGNKVFAVEPNKEMREASVLFLSKNKNFISVEGTAEKSNLRDGSIDIVFSGQAFHWFDKNRAKIEFNRILKPEGNIVLAWNVRNEQDEFQKEYAKILSNIDDHNKVTHKNISEEEIAGFFSPRKLHKESTENSQAFGLEGLKGRLKSSSYCPKEGLEFEQIMKDVENLFHDFKKDGVINFLYDTNIYWC